MNAKQKIWKMTRPVLRPGTMLIALFYQLRIFQEYSKKNVFFLDIR